MGTPEFMAPEQVTNPDSVDERTDIYALGVVFYEMLASRTPFVNENDNDALLHKIILEKPPELKRPEVPPGLVEMIFERMLAKEPAKRFQSMKDVKAALEAFWGATRRDSQPIEPISIEEVQAAAAAAGATAVAAAAAPKAAEPVIAVAGGAREDARSSDPSDRARRARRARRGRGRDADVEVGQAGAGGECHGRRGDRRRCRRARRRTRRGRQRRPLACPGPRELADAARGDRDRRGDDPGHDSRRRAGQAGAGEVIDLVQVRDGKHVSLLRMPASAKPLGQGDEERVVVEGGQLRVVAGAPVTQANGTAVAGEVLISAPVDLQAVAGKLKDHALDARLEGIGAPIALVPGSHPDGEAVTRPVQSKALKGAALTLAATVARVMPPDV